MMSGDAVFSPDGLYRYLLIRQWDDDKPSLAFILLNPSTADATLNDPTINKCMAIARHHGYGGIRVANLFAFRATDPRVLKKSRDPIGPDNDHYLQALAEAHVIVAAWGNHGTFCERSTFVKAMLSGRSVMCLAKNANGEPKHPLYIKTETPLIPFF